MKNGCGIVARTEELTPPGMTDSARSYSPRERSWSASEGWIGSVKVVAEPGNEGRTNRRSRAPATQATPPLGS